MKNSDLLGILFAVLCCLISIPVNAVMVGSFDASRVGFYAFEPGGQYDIILTDMSARGDSSQLISTITNESLRGIEIFFVNTKATMLSNSEQDALVDWVNRGGTLFAGGSSPTAAYDSILNPFCIYPSRMDHSGDPIETGCDDSIGDGTDGGDSGLVSCTGRCLIPVTEIPNLITDGPNGSLEEYDFEPGNTVGGDGSYFLPGDYNTLIGFELVTPILLQKHFGLGQIVAFYNGREFTDSILTRKVQGRIIFFEHT